HVRAGRRRELGVDHGCFAWLDGAAPAAQLAHGTGCRRQHHHPATLRLRRSRCRPRRLWRAQSTQLAAPPAGMPDRGTDVEPMTHAYEFESALRHDDRRHLAAAYWLTEEAALLDARRWNEWLELLADDIRYVMPVRVTTSVRGGNDVRGEMAHFDEDRYSLV